MNGTVEAALGCATASSSTTRLVRQLALACTSPQCWGATHSTACRRQQLLPALRPLRPKSQHQQLQQQQQQHLQLRTAVAASASRGSSSSLLYQPPVCASISRDSSSRQLHVAAPSLLPSPAAAGPHQPHLPVQPIIVAASWLGAKRGPFSKYTQLWQSLGYGNVLAARPPMTAIMFPLQGQLVATAFTHRLLAAARAHPHAPILIHLFSGGGFIFMAWVFQLLADLRSEEADALRARVAGVVLDSSPALVNPDVSSRALVAAALGKPAAGIEDAYPWLVRPTAAIVGGYLGLPFVRQALVGADAAWVLAAPRCPQLYLYSEADALIAPGVVEAFMSEQAGLGCDTVSHKWADSGHVDHYRVYPQEYRQQLAAFAERVLTRAARVQGGAHGGGGGGGEHEV